jgi:hypothetical protein
MLCEKDLVGPVTRGRSGSRETGLFEGESPLTRLVDGGSRRLV